MPLLVRMHIYSGRPDRGRLISGDSERESSSLAGGASPGVLPNDVGRLGYRGFTVIETTGETDPRHLFAVQQVGSGRAPSHSVTGVPELEHFLLWTGHEHVSDTLAAHAQQV